MGHGVHVLIGSIETKRDKYARKSAGTTTTTRHACHVVRMTESFPSVIGVLKSYFSFLIRNERRPLNFRVLWA